MPRLGDLLWGENNCTLGQGAGLTCDGDTMEKKVFVERATLTITEGKNKSYGIALGQTPTGTVTVTVSEPAGVTVSPTTLTFTTGNYLTWQDVTVTVPEDEDRNDLTVTITHDVSGGGYGSVFEPSVTVQGLDDERVPERVTPKPEVSPHSDTAVRARWTVPDWPRLADHRLCRAVPGVRCVPGGRCQLAELAARRDRLDRNADGPGGRHGIRGAGKGEERQGQIGGVVAGREGDDCGGAGSTGRADRAVLVGLATGGELDRTARQRVRDHRLRYPVPAEYPWGALGLPV